MDEDLSQAFKDWSDLGGEYEELQNLHKEYLAKLDEAIRMQKKCQSGVNHQRYRVKAIEKML